MATDWQRIDAGDGDAFLERFADVDTVPPVFRALREEWVEDPEPSDHNPEGLPERVILETELVLPSR